MLRLSLVHRLRRPVGLHNLPRSSGNFAWKHQLQYFSSSKDISDSLETVLASAGCNIDDRTGAVSPPIYLSTTYERDDNLQLTGGFNYSRLGNPTRLAFERAMVEIEAGSEAMAFASGMQAAVALFMACPKAHIILPDDLYHGVLSILMEIFQPWGVTFEKVDMTDPKKVTERLEEARKEFSQSPEKKLIFWIETPSNPTCKVTDIARLSELVHGLFPNQQAVVVVDSTWSTPYLTRPLSLGADVVLHSTTKYISGHSDSLGGCLVLGNTDAARNLSLNLRHFHQVGGGVLSPFDSYMTMRGLRTLHVRMKQHCENAMILAEYLAGHKAVQHVYYPGLVGHPQNKLASSQMSGRYGGMLSFLVKGKDATSEVNALEVVKHVKLFKRATSLGGTESLIEHRATVEGKYRSSAQNLLRVSVGLENVGDLLTDLDIALSKVHI